MLKVKKSRIKGAGNGLFTTSRIRKGDVIIEYKGERMPWKKCLKRYGENIHNARYLFYISPKNCIDAQYTEDELARYANDAFGFNKKKGLKNNSEYEVIRGRAYVVAVKPINAGSEIFVDYQREYWEAMEEMLAERKKELRRKSRIKNKKTQKK